VSWTKLVLRIIALTFLVGGIARLFANETLFEAFSIGELWMQQPYSLYIYRILGGFVIFTAIILIIIAGDPLRYRVVLKGFGFGLLLVGIVMTVSGLSLGLPLRYYLPDPIYCFVVTILVFVISRSG
jgi:hypothetical protein